MNFNPKCKNNQLALCNKSKMNWRTKINMYWNKLKFNKKQRNLNFNLKFNN